MTKDGLLNFIDKHPLVVIPAAFLAFVFFRKCVNSFEWTKNNVPVKNENVESARNDLKLLWENNNISQFLENFSSDLDIMMFLGNINVSELIEFFYKNSRFFDNCFKDLPLDVKMKIDSMLKHYEWKLYSKEWNLLRADAKTANILSYWNQNFSREDLKNFFLAIKKHYILD